MPEKWERRATIRETWGNVNTIQNYPIKAGFLLILTAEIHCE